MMPRLVDALTAVCRRPGTIDLFVGDTLGVIWHRQFTGSTWTGWKELGRAMLPASDPPVADWLAAAVSGIDRIELFAHNGTMLYHRRFGNGAWSARWEQRAFPTAATRPGGFAAAATGSEDLHIVYCDTGNRIVQWALKPSTSTVVASDPPRRLRTIPIQGGFELLCSHPTNGNTKKYSRRQFAGGTWGETRYLSQPTGVNPFSDTFAASANQLIVAAGDNRYLWSRPFTGASWAERGGLLSSDGNQQDILTAVATTSTRTDVFALWAPAGIMHRWVDGDPTTDSAWAPWQLHDTWPGPSGGEFTVVRPNDLVHFRVRNRRFTRRLGGSGVPELVAGPGAQLDVNLPPQHITEEVAAVSQARSAGPSRLRFTIPNTTVITLTTAGLLQAMTQHELPPPTGEPDSASVLEIPFRLLMSLPSGARCSTGATPVISGQQVTGLWHCELTDPDAAPTLALRPVRALARDTSAFTQTIPLERPLAIVNMIVAKAAQYPQTPVRADNLTLSSIGAWYSLSAEWPGLQWTHRGALGRDYYVRVALSGRLFPFGHRAIYVFTTERRFSTDFSDKPAHLQNTHTLIVTEPERRFGAGEGGLTHERAFPFQKVGIARELTWTIDSPGEGHTHFWPKLFNTPIEFPIVMTSGRETVEVRLPLLFVTDDGPTSATQLDEIYRAGPSGAAVRPSASIGRDIALISTTVGRGYQPVLDTLTHISRAEFGIGTGSSGTHPKLCRMKVRLPAVNRILGPAAPGELTAEFSDEMLRAASPTSLLKLVTDTGEAANIPLGFVAAGAATGAVASPNMSINTIARNQAPLRTKVGGAVETAASAIFDDTATLLGVVNLRTVFGQVATGQPAITWENGVAKLTWIQRLPRKTIGSFVTKSDSWLELTVDNTKTLGKITDFELRIPETTPAVLIDFTDVTFTTTPASRPSINLNLKISLSGDLRFVQTLQSYMLKAGVGPEIRPLPTAITVRYVAALPALPIGVFMVKNLAIESALTFSLENKPLTIAFSFGTRQRPFLVTVSGLGGGGYLEVEIGGVKTPSNQTQYGLTKFVGGLEFGASVEVNFIIVSAEVHVFGGIVFELGQSGVKVIGYLRIGGSIDLLGLIRVAVELTISLSYDSGRNVLEGQARLVVVVDLTLWSTSFELTCRKSFAGPELLESARESLEAAAPTPETVAATLGPVGADYPWREYCRAFAGA